LIQQYKARKAAHSAAGSTAAHPFTAAHPSTTAHPAAVDLGTSMNATSIARRAAPSTGPSTMKRIAKDPKRLQRKVDDDGEQSEGEKMMLRRNALGATWYRANIGKNPDKCAR
jgi:hypothetical protein